MKKTSRIVALGLVALILAFAVVSFLRENWSAAEQPGAIESFLARWALRHARSGENDTPNPLQPTQENIEQGRQNYEKQCAFCHGLDGKGQGQTGVQFYPPVPALTGQINQISDGQMQSIISKGIRYTAMPSFAKALAPEEIWKIVLWVRHLPAQPPATQPNAESPDKR